MIRTDRVSRAQREWLTKATLTLGILVLLPSCKKSPASSAELPPAGAAASVTSNVAAAVDAGPFQIPEITMRKLRALPQRFERSSTPASQEEIESGRKLFFDQKLSVDGSVSCNSCHRLDAYGTDGQRRSAGTGGRQTSRNTPSVFNVGAYERFGWDGRETDLETFVEKHLASPEGMGRKASRNDRATAEALGAFLRGLNAPSVFDRFVSGDATALSDLERRGLAFHGQYCAECHDGVGLGGNRMAKLGAMRPYPPEETDLGLYMATKKEDDRLMFRVPTLRNLAKTGPYLHGGRMADLTAAVEAMAWHECGAILGERDEQALMAFLLTLTGTLPEDLSAAPP